MTLKVPYNFVPLNEKVVRPYWIDHISHDVPFKDGLSGTLKLTLTAESPIFVRRGTAKPPQDNNDKTKEQQAAYEFEQDENDNYFIPGSSLRGMVRSVVETLSFGRMISRVSERRYAVRDLSRGAYDIYLSQFSARGENATQCGWLRFDKDSKQYIVQECGAPGRISQYVLQEQTNVPIIDYYSKEGGFDNSKDSEKSAERKYKLFADHQAADMLNSPQFIKSYTKEVTTEVKGNTKTFVVERCKIGRKDDEDTGKGKIVLTGQPGERFLNTKGKKPKMSGKFLEFVFWEDENVEEIIVQNDIIDDFKSAYLDYLPEKQQSDDYKWRKKQLENGGKIPIFYRRGVDKKGQPTVEHFGLSYLYKLPYDNTVEDSIRENQDKPEAYDLADAIFGMVSTNGSKSTLDFLKGRVQFSHAKTENTQTKSEEKVILGEPRASFYPTYMKQSGKAHTGRYNTFMDDRATAKPIAGRKRYPVLEDGTRKTNFEGVEADSPLITKFLPLDAGTTFTCDLHYHNLRPVELGALLSALTFHGTEKSRHQVGMAKPLGFGKVKMNVEKLTAQEQTDYLLHYEAFMDMALGTTWRETEQVKELVALTTPVKRENVAVLDGNFAYNSLGEFKQVKNNQEVLEPHAKARGGDFTIEAVGEQADKDRIKTELKKDKARFINIEPMTEAREKQLKEEAARQIREATSTVVFREVEKLQAALKALKEEAERERAAANRKKKQDDALGAGLNLDSVKAGRDAFKKLKQETDKYIAQRQGINTNKLTTENRLLPESDWKELTDKVKEIYGNKQARKKSFSEKQLARTKSEVQWYLGEEATERLFQELK